MKISDFLNKESIFIGLQAKDKKEAINELVDLAVNAGKVKKNSKKKIIKALLDREELGSTGIGQGIAIPHAKSEDVNDIVCTFGSSKKGVDFDALDGEPVYLLFLLIAPQDSAGMHLKALAKISRLLKDRFFRQVLMEANSAEEILKVIKEEDE